jgi:proline iminopeptidase
MVEMAAEVRMLGSGPLSCTVLASAGAAWSEATLPAPLRELLTLHLVVPSHTARSISAVVDELAAVADELSDPPMAAGVSMNGTLALAAAATHPEVFSSVVGVACPPRLPPDRDVVARYSYAIEPERKQEFERRRAEAEAAPEGSAEEQTLWRRVDAVRRWHDLSFDPSPLDQLAQVDRGWIQAVMGDGEHYDWPATISALRCPVLLILGRSDFVVPRISWDVESLPAHFTVEVFERSGHTPPYEEPDRFVAAVRTWLERTGQLR